jgi:hypothetical protein
MWKVTLARMMPIAVAAAFFAVGFALRFLVGSDDVIGAGS